MSILAQRLRDLVWREKAVQPNPPAAWYRRHSESTDSELAQTVRAAIAELAVLHPSLLKSGGPRGAIGSVKVYSPKARLKLGNEKLRGILIWDLPAVSTCPVCETCRKGCYALAAQTVYPGVANWRMENWLLWLVERDRLEEIILRQVRTSKYRHFRIHSSGDFWSQRYIDWWASLVKRFPADVKVYAYTKADSVYNVEPLLDAGVNVIYSVVRTSSGEKANFGSPEHLLELVDWLKKDGRRANRDYKVCPATYSDHYLCGEKRWMPTHRKVKKDGKVVGRIPWEYRPCVWCTVKSTTLFVDHGSESKAHYADEVARLVKEGRL